MEAVTAFNRPVFASHAEVTALVRYHLGVSAAALFATPRHVDGQIVWTTDIDGPIRGWMALTPAERARIDPVRRELGASLAALAGRLRQGGINTRMGNQAHLLEAALVIPGVAHLHAVGDRPVLAFWGFRPPGAPGLDPLGAELPAPPEPVVAPPAVRRRRWPWLLAVLALLLVLLSTAAVWRQLAVVPPVPAPEPVPKPEVKPVIAPVEPAPAPPARPVLDVVPPEPVKPEPIQPPPAPVEPPPLPKLPDLPSVPAAPQQDAGLMHMPQNGDLSNLSGCWQTDRYSYGTRASKGYSVYCFDAQGRGHLTHTEQAYHCEAPANIEMRADGSMYLADRNSTCSDGGTWYQDRLLCSGDSDGVAHCRGESSHPGGIVHWSTTLRRR